MTMEEMVADGGDDRDTLSQEGGEQQPPRSYQIEEQRQEQADQDPAETARLEAELERQRRYEAALQERLRQHQANDER